MKGSFLSAYTESSGPKMELLVNIENRQNLVLWNYKNNSKNKALKVFRYSGKIALTGFKKFGASLLHRL